METTKFFMYYIIVFMCFALAGQLFSSGSAYDFMENETIADYDHISVLDPDYWHYDETNTSPIANIPIIGGFFDRAGFMLGRSATFFTDLFTFNVPWIPSDFTWIRALILIPFYIALTWVIISYVRGVSAS